MKIIIIGAGPTGLALSKALALQDHEVHILEKETQEKLKSSHSGLNLRPNGIKVLRAWGLLEDIRAVAVANPGVGLRTQDGTVLSKGFSAGEDADGYIHRSDICAVLLSHARDAGVQLHFGTKVVGIDLETGSTTLGPGDVMSADLVIGADGALSKVRQIMLPNDDCNTVADGSFCYQVSIPADFAQTSTTFKQLYEDSSTWVWLGDGRMVVGAPIPTHQVYDLHLQTMVRPDDEVKTSDKQPWTAKLDADQVKKAAEQFSDFDPALVEMLQEAKDAWIWRMAQTPELPSWSSESGRVVLVGDAAHSFLPYVAQGLNQNLESAAVLAEVLVGCEGTTDALKTQLEIYEDLRKPRVRKIVDAAYKWGQLETIGPGPERDRRDAVLRARDTSVALHAEPDENALFFTPQFMKWMTEYDAITEARKTLGIKT